MASTKSTATGATDLASLLGNMLLQLQQRHSVPDPDTGLVSEADVLHGEVI